MTAPQLYLRLPIFSRSGNPSAISAKNQPSDKTFKKFNMRLEFAFSGDFYFGGETLKSFPIVAQEQQQNSSTTKIFFHPIHKVQQVNEDENEFAQPNKMSRMILFMYKVCGSNWMWKLVFCCPDFWFFLPLLIPVILRRWIVKAALERTHLHAMPQPIGISN